MKKQSIIFGFHAVAAVLASAPERIVKLYQQADIENKRLQTLLEQAQQNQIAIEVVDKQQLNAWAQGARHQGVLIEVLPQPLQDEEALLSQLAQSEKPPFLLLLDEVQDPHNLGACLRSANGAGVDAVIITTDRSTGLTPVVRKVAAGAAETTPVITVTNLASTLRRLKKAGIWIFGLAGEAAEPIYQTDLTGPIGLVLGAEGKGLRRLTRSLCDRLIAIPMAGSVSSLNVSVATGVALFEIVRQRQLPRC
jgi:23S rRNA (guanosine2251-2'-O)-methyltransferase